MWFSHVKRKGDSADFQVNICIEIPNNWIAILEYERIWNHYALKVKIIKPVQDQNVTKAWFSLVHKHKRRDIPTCRMAYLTQFLTPALLNPMVNKMTDALSAILLLICSHEVWVKVAYDWPMALCLCWLCFHQLKLWHQHKHKHKKNELVRFSCAYAYAYNALVKTRLKISSCRVNTTSGWVIKQLGISFGLFLFYFLMKVARGHIRGSRGKTLAPGSYKVSFLWCAAKWSFALYDC